MESMLIYPDGGILMWFGAIGMMKMELQESSKQERIEDERIWIKRKENMYLYKREIMIMIVL